MEQVLNTIQGTPVWVWAVLAYLLFVGIRATKSRSVYIPKAYLIPIIFIAIKSSALIHASSYILLSYFAPLVLGLLIGGFIAKNENFAVGYGFSVYLPGSYQLLLVLTSFFAFKYTFGYLSATNAELYAKYMWLEFAGSGLLTGYMLGKAAIYTIIFFIFKKHQLN